MILLAPLLTLQMKQPRVRELKFTNSVFDSTTFSTMSPQLPEIDTLIFKGCFVKHDSHARFDIEIPETKLGHLELDLSHIDDKRQVH
ncbi:hypothetical protein BD408DRAFT_412122 [Parasitella parasitica]|nr:hypothetical protein BD408DRAFT_412122 [Parasitella parasitica]